MRKLGYTLMVFLLFFCLFSICYGQDYQIGTDDVIEVIVWDEPEFSREVVVRPDGKISLPAVGDVQVEGFTAEALSKNLQEILAKYIKTPKVSVIVKEINQKIYVLGKVARPGSFPLESDMTVLQAIAEAGGFTDWAKRSKVTILRKSNEGEQKIKVNLNKVVQGKKGGEDVRLQSGDKIIVP